MSSAMQGGCRGTKMHLVAVLHEEEQIVLVRGARWAARHEEKLHGGAASVRQVWAAGMLSFMCTWCVVSCVVSSTVLPRAAGRLMYVTVSSLPLTTMRLYHAMI
jgi:hypothetical protein